MMLYQYTYLDFKDILNITGKILEQESNSIMLIIFGISLLFIIFLLLFPLIIITLKYKKTEKEKQIKKNLLTEILLKKELEDEIEKEVIIDKSDT